MKPIAPRAHLFFIFPIFLFIAASVACSNHQASDHRASGDAGTVAFNLSWGDAATQASGNYGARQVTGDVCADYHIQRIHAQALDQDGHVQASGEWTCTRRRGEMTGLPAGDYKIIIQGEVSGVPAWSGEAANVTVALNQQTDAGVINMVHLHDQTAPVVVQTLPANGSRDIPVDLALTARFDAAIVTPSIGADNFILTYNNASGNPTPVACNVSYDSENHTAILSPVAPLLTDTAYTATVVIDGNLVVEDLAGNAMEQPAQWTFTTYRPDVDGPTIQFRFPEHGTLNVVHGVIVQIRFSEAVNPATISTNSIYLEQNGVFIQSVLAYDDQLNLVTLTPVGGLESGVTYTVMVTTDILDLAGNPMASDQSWSFVSRFPSWRTENVDGPLIHASTRITREKNDRIHVVVSQAGDGKMVDRVRTSETVWTTNSLSGSSDVGLNFDMLITGGDTRLTTYFDQELEMHFEWQTIPPGATAGGTINVNDPVTDLQGISIAENPADGWASIAYFDAGRSQLKYTADAGDWNHEVVDTDAGRYPALTMSSTGEAHISYYDQVNGHLKYATRTTEGVWVKETVDAGTIVGLDTDIVLDAAGNPHISYLDSSASDLKYATRLPSGQWLVETADNVGNVGYDTSIALDSLGLVHISYLDASASDLKYACRTSIGSWHTQTVDPEGGNGYGSSITVDSQDYVHISYTYKVYSISDWHLRYATTRPSN